MMRTFLTFSGIMMLGLTFLIGFSVALVELAQWNYWAGVAFGMIVVSLAFGALVAYIDRDRGWGI